ncbi:phosphoenolpyruvate synthase [Hahella sp. KA22]|uniref:PEP/pyruvate-binding domain-containing protein n=1 Tax=Hahella sp. KA22 TaxID=1628392 RepID=UPI000FDD5FED|nr:PEP/pyruvate-binding domain-containing protein [Hahella sp. KA22]AZZ94446.1 phosphoenolpyruvate synthase [Hahella sp. KA22]QAY57820.1 phosphoenolpyruvate synthase [Hahella sp. KA22]
MTYDSHIVEVSGQQKSNTQSLGGKASSLNTLAAAGFPVPRAYCLTVDAYASFLQESGLDQWISGLEQWDASAFTQIRQRIEDTQLPSSLRQAIVGAYKDIGAERVAVRSSAISEDSEEHSFAGQYDTYLHVENEENLVDCVKRCWGSFWTERAHAYEGRQDQRRSNDANAPKQGIAVVIQAMIDADAAGVLFTADPLNGDPQRTVIESCWGLGEGVVSGQVTTDTFVVDNQKMELLEQTLREKPVMSTRAENGGVCLRKTATDKINAPTLNENEALALAGYANAIRSHYGREMDIEWALKDGKIWILQARPITVTPTRGDNRLFADADESNSYIRDNALFSRMDTGEIVTGLMTPLGLSFCRFYQHKVHGPAVKTMGLLDIGDSQHYMGYLQGHVYLNISASAMLLTQCPPTRDPLKFTKRYSTEEVDLNFYTNPYGKAPQGLQYLKSAGYWTLYQVRNLMTAERTVRDMISLRKRETERFLKLDLSAMSLSELNAEMQRIDRYFLESCAAYMPFFLQSFALYDALAELCEKWLGDTSKGLQNRIKASLSNLRTIEVTRGVCDLAASIQRSNHLRQLVLETPLEQLAQALQNDAEGARFWNNDFMAFLRDYGARGRQEFELSIPRWADDPSYLLQVIRMYLTSDVQLESRLEEIDRKRDDDTRALLSGLPLRIRLLFKFVISTYAKMAERREATRPTYIAQTWFYRKIIVEVMRRLSAEKVLKMEDLPYIDFNELRDYLAGKKSAQQAFSAELIERNRRSHLLNQRLQEPPMAIVGGHTPQRETAETAPTDDNQVFQGIGASPGVAMGRARVITDLPRQAEEFQQGEILVARFTDASWTPLFVLAAGVVADVGSMLSHSSIVSREFGIPAIVNTKTTTRRIRTGDMLYLDGDAGIVRIEERKEDASQ